MSSVAERFWYSWTERGLLCSWPLVYLALAVCVLLSVALVVMTIIALRYASRRIRIRYIFLLAACGQFPSAGVLLLAPSIHLKVSLALGGINRDCSKEIGHLLSGSGLMEGFGGEASGERLEVTKHVERDSGDQTRHGANSVNALLHLAMTPIPTFDGVGSGWQ